VLSIVESTLDNPGPVLAAQWDKLRTETLGRLNPRGVEYDARMEALDKLERPKPLREFKYDLFDSYRSVILGRSDHNIEPNRWHGICSNAP